MFHAVIHRCCALAPAGFDRRVLEQQEADEREREERKERKRAKKVCC